jgi:hypothetical protein
VADVAFFPKVVPSSTVVAKTVIAKAGVAKIVVAKTSAIQQNRKQIWHCL